MREGVPPQVLGDGGSQEPECVVQCSLLFMMVSGGRGGMRPMTVVSSANFRSLTEGSLEVQSFV